MVSRHAGRGVTTRATRTDCSCPAAHPGVPSAADPPAVRTAPRRYLRARRARGLRGRLRAARARPAGTACGGRLRRHRDPSHNTDTTVCAVDVGFLIPAVVHFDDLDPTGLPHNGHYQVPVGTTCTPRPHHLHTHALLRAGPGHRPDHRPAGGEDLSRAVARARSENENENESESEDGMPVLSGEGAIVTGGIRGTGRTMVERLVTAACAWPSPTSPSPTAPPRWNARRRRTAARPRRFTPIWRSPTPCGSSWPGPGSGWAASTSWSTGQQGFRRAVHGGRGARTRAARHHRRHGLVRFHRHRSAACRERRGDPAAGRSAVTVRQTGRPGRQRRRGHLLPRRFRTRGGSAARTSMSTAE